MIRRPHTRARFLSKTHAFRARPGNVITDDAVVALIEQVGENLIELVLDRAFWHGSGSALPPLCD